jgi:hypothetical protein
LSEERLSKRIPCPDEHGFYIICWYPINLQMNPYSSAEVALKKEMDPVLSNMTEA